MDKLQALFLIGLVAIAIAMDFANKRNEALRDALDESEDAADHLARELSALKANAAGAVTP